MGVRCEADALFLWEKSMLERAADFFAFMRKRHQIYLDKTAGKPWPWTDDTILQEYSFTNVFREYDRVTMWFKNNVRQEMRDKPEVLLATVLFRWFNRPNVGEAIFLQKNLLESTRGPRDKDNFFSAWDSYLKHGNSDVLKTAILAMCGTGPYVNGAYIILGQQGMSKLPGVLACVDVFNNARDSVFMGRRCHWRDVAESCLASPTRLEEVWKWLKQTLYLGDFMAYEIVTDLRHTDLLCGATDIMNWANPGPGAARGLARVTNRGVKGRMIMSSVPKGTMITEMWQLLMMSKRPEYWPKRKGWPALEMREIEHTLCEFDKYERTRTGDGTPKARYRRK